MPPSGFNQRAVNGLLHFVQATYEDASRDIGQFSDERELLEQRIDRMEERVQGTGQYLGLPAEAIRGLAMFVTENYRDLINEIVVGKKPLGEAMQREIEDIRSYLTSFDIHRYD